MSFCLSGEAMDEINGDGGNDGVMGIRFYIGRANLRERL